MATATTAATEHNYLCTGCQEPLQLSLQQIEFLNGGSEIRAFCHGKNCDLVYHIGPNGILWSYHNIDPNE